MFGKAVDAGATVMDLEDDVGGRTMVPKGGQATSRRKRLTTAPKEGADGSAPMEVEGADEGAGEEDAGEEEEGGEDFAPAPAPALPPRPRGARPAPRARAARPRARVRPRRPRARSRPWRRSARSLRRVTARPSGSRRGSG
eukprot:scaffold39821_cov33-Phaeocystis_antarctica.AAC.1